MAPKLPPFKLDAASGRAAGGAALEIWARYKLLFLGILGWAIGHGARGSGRGPGAGIG